MPPASNRQQTRRTLIVISIGWALAVIWWAAAGQWKYISFQNVSNSLGGFPLALLAVWLISRQPVNATNPRHRNQKPLLTWLFLAFLYPLVTLLWLCFEVFGIAPMENFSWLTHPAFLAFNLVAGLVSGPLLNRISKTGHLSNQLRKAFICGDGRLIPALLWWLWQLPFIFVNGAVLNQMEFPLLWLALYLLTALVISFFITWVGSKERREVPSTAF